MAKRNQNSFSLNTPWPVRLVSVIVFLNGLFALAEVLTNRLPGRIEDLLPFDYDYAKSLGVFAGFILMYFASQLYQRKRLAWWITSVGSLLIIAAHTIYARDISVLILPSIALAMLLAYENLFTAKSEPASISQGLRLLVLTVVLALIYGAAGFLLLLPRDFHQPFTLGAAVSHTLRAYLQLGNPDLVAHSRHAKWFLRSLDFLGVAGLGFAVLSLFRPLAYRYRTLPHDRQRARELLDKYGDSSEDFFKLWPEDKSYFFHGDCLIAYKVDSGVAFALGDITGPAGQRAAAMQQFVAYCQSYGWTACWIYTSAQTQRLAKAAGLRVLKIGDDAIVDLAAFQEKTAGNKHFRHVRNKFTKLGYTAELLEPPQASATVRELASVSHSWISISSRVERSFALGYFDRKYLAGSRVFLVRDGSGRAVAFANLIPSFNPGEANFDLMRHRHNSETGVMDFLFLKLIEQLLADGWRSLNFGLAPFSGLEDVADKNVEERFVALLYRSQFKLANFQGLRRYKDKFEPDWQPRYLAYEGTPASLPRIGLAVNRVVQAPRLP